jgi:hypothetical protein
MNQGQFEKEWAKKSKDQTWKDNNTGALMLSIVGSMLDRALKINPVPVRYLEEDQMLEALSASTNVDKDDFNILLGAILAIEEKKKKVTGDKEARELREEVNAFIIYLTKFINVFNTEAAFFAAALINRNL